MAPVLKFLQFSSGSNAEMDLENLDKAVSVAKKNEIKVEVIQEASEIHKLLTEKALNNHICVFHLKVKCSKNLNKMDLGLSDHNA